MRSGEKSSRRSRLPKPKQKQDKTEAFLEKKEDRHGERRDRLNGGPAREITNEAIGTGKAKARNCFPERALPCRGEELHGAHCAGKRFVLQSSALWHC